MGTVPVLQIGVVCALKDMELQEVLKRNKKRYKTSLNIIMQLIFKTDITNSIRLMGIVPVLQLGVVFALTDLLLLVFRGNRKQDMT